MTLQQCLVRKVVIMRGGGCALRTDRKPIPQKVDPQGPPVPEPGERAGGQGFCRRRRLAALFASPCRRPLCAVRLLPLFHVGSFMVPRGHQGGGRRGTGRRRARHLPISRRRGCGRSRQRRGAEDADEVAVAEGRGVHGGGEAHRVCEDEAASLHQAHLTRAAAAAEGGRIRRRRRRRQEEAFPQSGSGLQTQPPQHSCRACVWQCGRMSGRRGESASAAAPPPPPPPLPMSRLVVAAKGGWAAESVKEAVRVAAPLHRR